MSLGALFLALIVFGFVFASLYTVLYFIYGKGRNRNTEALEARLNQVEAELAQTRQLVDELVIAADEAPWQRLEAQQRQRSVDA